jgi:stress response protein YsnF
MALSEVVDVQRVPMNQQVDALLEVRYEGDTLVIPVIEEVLVVEKRLMLKEEVRVTRRTVQTPIQQPVTVRKQEVIVQHLTPEEGNESQT